MRASRKLSALASVAVAGTLLVSSTAMASGFAVARFGGGHGNPISVSPASIYYNPGAMAFNQGTNIYLDYTLAWRKASYDRVIGDPDQWSVPDPSLLNEDIQRQTNSGKGTLDNLIGSPMLGLTTDFGGSNFTLGAGFYVPFGGQAVWDEQSLPEPSASRAPYAADGPQRWFAIDGSIRVLTASLGFGVRTDDDRFGFGITTNLNITQVDTIRARNVDGSDAVVRESTGLIEEGRSQVQADGLDASIGLGIMYHILKNRLLFAASWQSAPNITGNQEIKGTLTNSLTGSLVQSETDIFFVQRLPQTFRWGFGYRFLEDPNDSESQAKAEVRLTGDVITWANLEHQCLVNRSENAGVNGDRVAAREACSFNDDGSYKDSGGSSVIQNIPRRWNTGWGVKLGASNYLSDIFELNYSVSYDSNAVPDRTLDPVLMDMPKMVLDVGAVISATDWLDISLLVANVFYFDRENTNSGLYDFDSPSVQPDANGTYKQNILLGNLGLNFHF